jgi:hypothetical protein
VRHEAGAEPGQLAGRALEHVDVVAEVAQEEGRRQPTQ